MTEDYKRGYSKGYAAGTNRLWPITKPPIPPDMIMSKIIEAAKELRDSADNICAILTPEDDFVKELSPKIDDLDRSMASLTNWCCEI